VAVRASVVGVRYGWRKLRVSGGVGTIPPESWHGNYQQGSDALGRWQCKRALHLSFSNRTSHQHTCTGPATSGPRPDNRSHALLLEQRNNLGFIWRITRCCTMSRSQKMVSLSVFCYGPTYIDDARSDTTQYKQLTQQSFVVVKWFRCSFSVLTVPMTQSRPGQCSYYMATNLQSICIIDRKIQEVSSLSVSSNRTASHANQFVRNTNWPHQHPLPICLAVW